MVYSNMVEMVKAHPFDRVDHADVVSLQRSKLIYRILMDFNGFDDVASVFSTMKRLPAVLAGAVCTCKYCFVLPELRWRSESGATGRIRCFWCRGHCPN